MSLAQPPPQLDALIIGGGIAGLWTLDHLSRLGHVCALIERDALGAGQTTWSQGIIHGGLKYTLAGLMNSSAEAIREMPNVWRRCLAGVAPDGPDLSGAPARGHHCYLWRTDSIASRIGMIGARVGLRVAPVALDPAQRPPILRECPGTVARLDEQVIDPASVLAALAAPNSGRIVLADMTSATVEPHTVRARIQSGDREMDIAARRLILAAGNGNGALRQAMGLEPGRVQVRPLRMTLVTAPDLPALYGHCVDGSATRLTITSARAASGHIVWQLGGELAERGVSMLPRDLIELARSELRAVLPGIDLAGARWGVYDAPRAEASTAGGRRPDDAVVIEDGPVLTAFPTKLALAPRLAGIIASLIGDPVPGMTAPDFTGWPRPRPALPPWETVEWT